MPGSRYVSWRIIWRSINTLIFPATVNDLEKLDIYGDLTAMPKNTDAEQDQASGVLIADENAPGGKQVSKKELGRLKSKQAVLAKVQAGGGNVGDEEMQKPEPKKSKSERGDDVPESGQDVQMTDVTV
jgi:tRNA (guanine-N(7)-)-methyltransferase subunit TRM82